MEFFRSISILFALFIVAAGQAKPMEEHDSVPEDLAPVLFAAEPNIEPAVLPEEIPAGYTQTPKEILTGTKMELPEPKIPEVPEFSYSPEEHMDMDYPPSGIERPEFSAPPVMYTTTHEHSVEMEENDLLASLEIGICGEVTCRTPFKERVQSWMCEYTKYTVELITWIREFEQWWHGCEESQMEGAVVWPNSVQCPDVSLVKCVHANKKLCADDRIGCNRCVCKDGMYADSPKLLKLWKKEVEAFKGRFEVYKTKVGTCTRVTSSEYECDIEDPPENVGSGSGSGEEVTIPDERDIDSGSGEESGSGEQNIIPDERDINYGSGSEEQSGSGEEMTDPNIEERDVGSGEQSGSGSGEEMTDPNIEERDVGSGGQSESGSGEELTDPDKQDREVQPVANSGDGTDEVDRTTAGSLSMSDHTTRAKQESPTTGDSIEYESDATTPNGEVGEQPEDNAEGSERTTAGLPGSLTERATEPSVTNAEHQAESTPDSMEYDSDVTTSKDGEEPEAVEFENTTGESADMAEHTTEAGDTSADQPSASSVNSMEYESTTEGDSDIDEPVEAIEPAFGVGAPAR